MRPPRLESPVALDDPLAYRTTEARPFDTGHPGEQRGAWPDEQVIHRGRRRPLPGLAGRLVALIDRLAAPFWNQPALFLLLVFLAVWAGIWGFTSFYGAQFAQAPWYTWLFIPDSPLSTTAWLVAATAIKLGWDRRPSLTGRSWAFFSNWVAMMNIMVGLWTVFVLGYHHEHFFAGGQEVAAFQWMLIIAHLGMVGLAVLLLRKVQALPALGYLAILFLAFLWVFMDYFFVDLFLHGSGTKIYPMGIPDHPATLRVVAGVTATLALLATAFVTVVMYRRGPPSAR